MYAHALAAWLLSCAPAQPQCCDAWAAYYSDSAPVEAFASYSLLVLDSDYHPPLEPLQERGKRLLGYVSLGEVEKHRYYFQDVRREGLLLGENPYWEDSFFVDVRDPRWTRRVIEQIVPGVLRRGFDGLFLDTLDNAAHLQRSDPARYAGMIEAARRLVRTIRRHYPGVTVMMNRAYEILPQVAGDIDIVLGESVYADYDFQARSYRRVQEELYRRQVRILREARRANPGLRVLTLDYWDPSDRAGIAAIYREQRSNGFEPYVATVELDVLVPEPPMASKPVEGGKRR